MQNLKIFELSKITKFLKQDISNNYLKKIEETNCGDKLLFFCELKNDKITNISFYHSGCILSKAVSNFICVEINDKSIKYSLDLIEEFLKMCEIKEKNSKFEIFKKFIEFESRYECLTNPAKIIKKVINEKRN